VLQEAVAWITARYKVPGIPKGRHTHSPEQWPEHYRVGCGTSRLEPLKKAQETIEIAHSIPVNTISSDRSSDRLNGTAYVYRDSAAMQKPANTEAAFVLLPARNMISGTAQQRGNEDEGH